MRLYLIQLITIISFGYAQPINHFYFINPGVKLGYALGNNGGFTYGFEISYVKTGMTWSEGKYGVVISIDRLNNLTKYHLGFEYIGGAVLGGELGPSLIIENGNVDFGLQATPFLSVFLIPYYSYTYVLNGSDIKEIGGFIKLPYQVEPKRSNVVFPIHD